MQRTKQSLDARDHLGRVIPAQLVRPWVSNYHSPRLTSPKFAPGRNEVTHRGHAAEAAAAMIDAPFDRRVGFERIGNLIDDESEAAPIL